jgi:eukaryotic-like serine/threonine-protein kinase
LTQRSRAVGAVVALLLLGMILSGCGAAPVAMNWPGLTVEGGIVYVVSGSPQKVYLLDAKTGVQQTSFVPQPEPTGARYWSPVAVGGDLAFVGFGVMEAKTYGLYAFDPKTGQERWHVVANDFILGAPVYVDGVVYYGASDGMAYAVDVETRSVKPGWPFQAGDAIWGSPLVVGGKVFVASLDHHLYCLDAQTGQALWDYEAGGAMATQPTLDPSTNILYIGDMVGKVNAVRADSGQPVEGFGFLAKNWIWSEILLSGDRLYVTSLDGNLYALDPKTGAILPPYPFDGGDVLRAAPVQSGDNILVASKEGRITSLDGKTGVQSWQWPSGLPTAQILTTPVVADGTLYALQTTGQLFALEAATGVQSWSFTATQGQ